MTDWDHRRAPWLPSPNRDESFDVFRQMAHRGLSRRQIARHLGTTYSALSSYFYRYGITMTELLEEEPT